MVDSIKSQSGGASRSLRPPHRTESNAVRVVVGGSRTAVGPTVGQTTAQGWVVVKSESTTVSDPFDEIERNRRPRGPLSSPRGG